MGKEGFQRLMKRLIEEGLNIGTISTDRHNQIRKLMMNEFPNIQHTIDPWHVIKGLTKNINKG